MNETVETDEMKRFRECAADPQSKIYFDYFDEGVRVLILRGPASVNAYFGVPIDHPLAGHSYDWLHIDAHGGLTFSQEGKDNPFPSGYWWYGCDYGHSGDMSFYDLDSRFIDSHRNDKAWTPEEIRKEMWLPVYQFQDLMKLAEAIAMKAMNWKAKAEGRA